MREKKFRNKKRHFNQFIRGLKLLEKMDLSNTDIFEYLNMKIPIYERLFNSKKTTIMLLNLYIQSAQVYFKNNQRENLVLTIILSSPNLFSSELCIFNSEKDFKNFCNRDQHFQKWIPSNKGIVEDLNLKMPSNFKVINFKEEIDDGDFLYSGMISILKYNL